MGRLLLVPIAVWLLVDERAATAFWVFVTAGISDAIDGFLARRFNARTPIGALLDPIADKTLLVSVYVTLGIEGQLPIWLVILVVFRDLLIVGGFLLLRAVSYTVGAQPLVISKLNTACQIALVAMVLARLGLALNFPVAERGFVYAVAVTTFLSGAGYIARWTKALAGLEQVS
jgi:cardiolipin synthase